MCNTRSQNSQSRCTKQADVLKISSQASMASGVAQHGAATTASITVLPAELLEHICDLLHDPDDLASCHLVDLRYARNTVVYQCVLQVRCKVMISLLQSCRGRSCQSKTVL